MLHFLEWEMYVLFMVGDVQLMVRTNLLNTYIENTTDTTRSGLYLDIHLEINSKCMFNTKVYYKRDSQCDLSCMCSSISASPTYGV